MGPPALRLARKQNRSRKEPKKPEVGVASHGQDGKKAVGAPLLRPKDADRHIGGFTTAAEDRVHPLRAEFLNLKLRPVMILDQGQQLNHEPAVLKIMISQKTIEFR